MSRSRSSAFLPIILALLVLTGCGGGGRDEPPPPATLTSIAVTPAAPSVVAGETVQFVATGTFSNGTTQNITSTVTWTSSAQAVATISGAGLASAVHSGTATITATSNSISGSTALDVTPPMISGTAAAGLPLVGTVTVKDALGAIKSVPLSAAGGYTVDVEDMTPPLMLRAAGTVGSTEYVMHSAVDTIGTGGTVNITPLTDLIIANVAGQIAASYFDNGDFSGLTGEELDAESAALKAKLLPVLTAMGVDAGIDLLRTPFTPLASALDAALDVIRVSIDPATHIATITNLLDQISIADDITVKAADETDPPTLEGPGLGTAADDLAQIRAVMTEFIDLFAAGLPQPSAILPFLSEGFRHQDAGRTDFANDLASFSGLVGGRIAGIQVLIDYDFNDGATPLASTTFTLYDEDGVSLGMTQGFTLIRGEDGEWLLHGDQSLLEMESDVLMIRDVDSGCRSSNLSFEIFDLDTSNSAGIQYVVIEGPGLPSGGLRFERRVADWVIVNNPADHPTLFPLASTCPGSAGLTDEVIAAIPDNATYTVTAFTASDEPFPLQPYAVASEIIPKRPLTLAELEASTAFPEFTTSVELETYAGGEITISGTNVNPAHIAWTFLGLTGSDGFTDSIDTDTAPSPEGEFSVEYTLSAPPVITHRDVRVASTDAFARVFMSTRFLRTPMPIGGTITGLTGTGLVLRLNGSTEPEFNVEVPAGATSFSFTQTLVANETYAVGVAVQPTNPTQLCLVGNGTGIVSAPVTNITVTCIDSAPYTVTGPVSGLNADGLTLRLRYFDPAALEFVDTDLVVAANDTTFAFPPETVAAGVGFNVGILTQPDAQTCTITRGVGFSLGDTVDNVGIACVDNVTDPLTGTYSSLDAEGRRWYFNFNADGTYTTAMVHNDTECNTATDTRNGNGVEYGVFSWDQATEEFTRVVPAVIDTNGSCGASSPDDPLPNQTLFSVSRAGDTIVVREPPGGEIVTTATAIESEPGTIVGAFVPEAGSGNLLVLHADGTFLWVETQATGLFPLGYGQERGCYTVEGSAVTLTIGATCSPDGIAPYDLNGAGGLFAAGITTTIIAFTIVDDDTITFRGIVFKRTQPN